MSTYCGMIDTHVFICITDQVLHLFNQVIKLTLICGLWVVVGPSSYYILLFKLQNSVWSTKIDLVQVNVALLEMIISFQQLIVFINWRFKITAVKNTKSSNLTQGTKSLRIPVNFRNRGGSIQWIQTNAKLKTF